MRISLIALAALALTSNAQAVTIINGSFEQGVAIGPSGSLTLATGDTTSIPGWRVLAQGVDYVSDALWDASAGSRSVDLSALTRGGISQTITGLEAGRDYRVRFDISANPFDPAARPRDKRFTVSASGNQVTQYSYSLVDANTATNMLYQPYEFFFTAVGANSGLSFQSLVADEYGVVLDNVSISLVPEPASWTLLIAGFGLVGIAARRRRPLHNVVA